MRASELRSPMPNGHFLRQFGQSNREVIENSSKDSDVTQILSILNAIEKTNLKVFWIYPNNDMGFNNILKKIKKTKNKNISVISNLERKSFLKLLSQS